MSVTADEFSALRRSRWLHGTAVLLSTLGTIQLSHMSQNWGSILPTFINAAPLLLFFWAAEAQLLANSCGTVSRLVFVQLVTLTNVFGFMYVVLLLGVI